MTAIEFKTGLKQIKSNLKGLTLQLVAPKCVRPYNTLREFGNAILKEETNGNSFRINQAWTIDGVVSVKSLNDLTTLLSSKQVTGIQFEAYYQSKDLADYMSYGYRYND